MRFPLVFKTLSAIWLILAFFMFLCSLYAFYYDEYAAFKSFQITIFFIIAISIVFLTFIKKLKNSTLTTKDSFLLVTLSWISASFFGALPFYFSDSIPSFTNCFFETASGFTTTGASILTNIESLPKSILLWRSITNWLGGMGIVVLTVAILPLLGVGGIQLLKAEAPGPSLDKVSFRIAKTAKFLWYIYLGFTLLLFALLLLGGMNFFDAITHAFSTLATGGFSVKQQNVMYYKSPFIQYTIAAFMLISGMNFALHYRLLLGNFKRFSLDSELKTYITIIFISVCLVTLNLFFQYDTKIEESFRLALFQVLTILTATGFATANFELWPHFSQVVLFLLMFMGGCSGSTSGGIKVVRILILLKQALNEMKFLLHPRGIFMIKLNKQPVKKDIVYAVSGFFFLYIGTILFITLIVASGGNSITTSLSASLATLGNIGPGFGSVGPSENYAHLSNYVKWALSLGMIAGRLEIYTFFIIFTPYFWKR